MSWRNVSTPKPICSTIGAMRNGSTSSLTISVTGCRCDWNHKFGQESQENSRELEDLAWFDENKTTLTLRVKQIMTEIHWAEEPPSRISHFVTNIRIIEANPSLTEASEVKSSSRFLVYRNRLQDETDILVGKREDVLRKEKGQWKIARRNIFLDQNVLLAKSLTFFFK